MDSQDQSTLLRVPTHDRDELSFCKSSLAGLAAWIDALPKANLGETARLLYQAIQELNQLDVSSKLRLELLELLRPEIAYVCKQLERFFFNQPLTLGERPRQVAGLCQALQKNLALGYKQVALALHAKPSHDHERRHALAVALQRAIHCLCMLQVRVSQLYNPAPAGLWRELHQLYAMAVEQGVQDMRVSDEVAAHARKPSVQTSYLVALLLGCARCNQMRQRSIGQLAELLEAWSGLVSLQPASSEGSLLAFSPQADEPPRYASLFGQAELTQLLGIDPAALVANANVQLANQGAAIGSALPVPHGVGIDLLQHLTATWSDISERTFHRAPAQGSLRLCIGMSALHYFLAGRCLFSDLLKHPVPIKGSLFEAGSGAADIWAHAFDAHPLERDLFAEQSIEYVAPSSETAAEQQPECFPTYEVKLVNHSPGGYCVAWPQEVPDQLQAGELVGLQDRDSEEWRVAVVRWLRQVRGGGLQMGIELIAPDAQPCGLKLVRNADQSSAYLRALLLPEIAALGRPATLIAPRLPFQAGHKVLINQHGDEHRAVLGDRQSSTGSYNQFQYSIVGRQPAPGAGAAAASPAAPREDFELLWPSL